ncbi:sigma-70 family RNA polymerase sigma factor [Nonomuraea fuscirosea]|uniref:sigma-70 family RNA polymerase sigma factor n=1 Tax=Nonomuraea fuscirosea TaxID=1291556 RepID=UPI0033D2B463
MSDTTGDAAYAAFAEVTWERHLAVAILLTGDRHRGEELLQDCLVRLYVRWRRVAVTDPHEELRRALLRLPRRQRTVVVLRHYEDLTEKAVAAVLGCSVGTVKSQHFRAMARLRAALRENQEAAR